MEMANPYAVVRTFKRGYPIRAGQMVRFGKVEYNVIEVNTSLVREVDYGQDNQQVLNLDGKDSSLPTTEKQAEDSQLSQGGRQCRVCLMGD
jgi:hypothetical protein